MAKKINHVENLFDKNSNASLEQLHHKASEQLRKDYLDPHISIDLANRLYDHVYTTTFKNGPDAVEETYEEMAEYINEVFFSGMCLGRE